MAVCPTTCLTCIFDLTEIMKKNNETDCKKEIRFMYYLLGKNESCFLQWNSNFVKWDWQHSRLMRDTMMNLDSDKWHYNDWCGGREGGGVVFAGRREMKIFSTVLRFWEKYDRETVFPTLDGAGNYWKNNEKSGFETIINGILIFEHLF